MVPPPSHCNFQIYLSILVNFFFILLISLMRRAERLGPVLKLVLCILVLPVPLILWPVVGIVGSIIGGAAYGFLSPIFATFDAVGEGRADKLYHCFYVCLQS